MSDPITQYDGDNAFAGLDMTAAKAKAEELAAREPVAEELTGAYQARKFTAPGLPQVWDEEPEGTVDQSAIDARIAADAETSPFWPIVTVETAVEIADMLDTAAQSGVPAKIPGGYLIGHRFGDGEAAIIAVHADGSQPSWLHIAGDASRSILLDFDGFEVVS